ncbi:hypothetical protein COMNV_01746 [Commensalibacter sp. Nvir]|nr:hypothetical protein COMNV_01746 [Commensalibacter sp. Nvir]
MNDKIIRLESNALILSSLCKDNLRFIRPK